MGKLKVYLDNCCYNRPYDDQSYINVMLETQAKLHIQSQVKQGVYDLVWSAILDYENNENPYEERRMSISKWSDIAKEIVYINENILANAANIMKLGIKNKDALHIASAIEAMCDYFITVDSKLLKTPVNGIKTVSPIEFVCLQEDKND